MESELEPIVRKLAEARWPWRIHATYDESIGRFLDIFERVHRNPEGRARDQHFRPRESGRMTAADDPADRALMANRGDFNRPPVGEITWPSSRITSQSLRAAAQRAASAAGRAPLWVGTG